MQSRVVQAIAGRLDPVLSPLSYTRWLLDAHSHHPQSLTDAGSCSWYSPTGCEGKKVREAVIATGDPVLGLYLLPEQHTSTSAVALASTVATKLTSAVLSVAKNSLSAMFWRSSYPSSPSSSSVPSDSPSSSVPEDKIDPPTVVSASCTIKDPQRSGLRLTVDNTSTLAACSDGLGRILLFNTRTFVIFRILKGYRDALCAFIRSNAVKGSSPRLHLVVYAPRRNLVELWNLRGPRVHAFVVPQSTRMLHDKNVYFIFPDGRVYRLNVTPVR
mmetsp:Transcript_24067/g.39549  ORF Transcript_24067/g.39549 Transcript_24067/m.39549 type:complete len:272 (+) Transcript_24067:146-961(+)